MCLAYEAFLCVLRWTEEEKEWNKKKKKKDLPLSVQPRLVATTQSDSSHSICPSDYYWHTRCECYRLIPPVSSHTHTDPQITYHRTTTAPISSLTGITSSWAARSAVLPDLAVWRFECVSFSGWKQEPDWWLLEQSSGLREVGWRS